MKMLARAALWLSVLCVCAPAMAQHATTSAAPAGFAPEYTPVTVAAISTPVDADVTPTGVTPVTGSGPTSFNGGVALLGPMTPQLGRDLRIIIRSTTPGAPWAGSIVIGTSTNGCLTINPLTVGGQPWGTYSANANEVFDTPTLAGVSYCATATITSGSAHVAVRQ